MAKRSSVDIYSERVKVEEPKATVRLRLRKDLILTVTGLVTGNQYTFNRAGSEVDVDALDAELLLKRMGSNSCCSGSSGPTAYFEVVR